MNDTVDTERECMKADELAKFLGVNRKTAYAYALRGVIPIGRKFGIQRPAARMGIVILRGERCKHLRRRLGQRSMRHERGSDLALHLRRTWRQ